MADVFRRDGAEDDLGTLEVGKLADIVLLDRLAVTHDFFTVYQTPNAVIAELETRFVARELRDNPERWLLLGRDGPPVVVAGIHLG